MTNDNLFVYVSCGGSREICVLRLAPDDGRLSMVQRVSVGGAVHPIAVSPDQRYLYASLRSEPYAASSFAIDPASGKLSHLSDAPLPGSMPYISTDRTGHFLLGASIPPKEKKAAEGGVISVSAIDSNGHLHPAHHIFHSDPKIHAVLAAPSNRYVLATNCHSDYIFRHVFDEVTGTFGPQSLAPVQVTPHAGPRHFIFHPDRRFVYLINETDATICAFSYDVETSDMRELQVVKMRLLAPAPQPLAGDLRITPDGRFLYASERVSYTLEAFAVDRTSGRLSSIGSFPTPDRPMALNVDPDGRYVVVTGQNAAIVTCFKIDRDTG